MVIKHITDITIATECTRLFVICLNLTYISTHNAPRLYNTIYSVYTINTMFNTTRLSTFSIVKYTHILPIHIIIVGFILVNDVAGSQSPSIRADSLSHNSSTACHRAPLNIIIAITENISYPILFNNVIQSPLKRHLQRAIYTNHTLFTFYPNVYFSIQPSPY